MIPFNKPYVTGKEIGYINDVIESGHFSGNGHFTQLCQSFFESRYGFKKALLTTSCTDALEMCALLINIKPGDEVIIPSFTFVSTALAFVRQGANIVFADSRADYPGIDNDQIEHLITERTKAIVPVHYAGIACDMDAIMSIANRHNLYVIEDAAHALESDYICRVGGSKRPLGSIGHLATFSFHETKNIQCGEGGLIAINDDEFIERSEIIWEKGTNRTKYFRGEIDKYGWVDNGSSFLPSEITAAFLWAQLQGLEEIQSQRMKLWKNYDNLIKSLGLSSIAPQMPSYSTRNGHMYYLILPSERDRKSIMTYMKNSGIGLASHYISLHSSPFFNLKYHGKELYHSDMYTDRLVRLPLFYELNQDEVLERLEEYFSKFRY